VIAAGLKEKVISQVGPASGCVRMNSHRCWPAGTVGSWFTVLQLPPVAPLPSQTTSAARATPASNTRAARVVTTTAPVFVNRWRKRCMTALPFPPEGGFVRSGSLEGASYQRRHADAAISHNAGPRPGQAESDGRRGKVAPLEMICRHEACTLDRAGCSSKPFIQPKGAGPRALPLLDILI
jgi:hypothetical protein